MKAIIAQIIIIIKEKKFWIIMPIVIFILVIVLFAFLSEKSISLPLLYQLF